MTSCWWVSDNENQTGLSSLWFSGIRSWLCYLTSNKFPDNFRCSPSDIYYPRSTNDFPRLLGSAGNFAFFALKVQIQNLCLFGQALNKIKIITMKIKHSIIIFLTGYCLNVVGILFRILHLDHTVIDIIFSVSTILTVAGVIIFACKLLTSERFKDFLD